MVIVVQCRGALDRMNRGVLLDVKAFRRSKSLSHRPTLASSRVVDGCHLVCPNHMFSRAVAEDGGIPRVYSTRKASSLSRMRSS
jgi:hypothetical protein